MKSGALKFEYIVGGWPWQILGMICSATTAGEPGEIFLSNKQRTISPISRRTNFTKFEHNTSIGVAIKIFRTEFWKFYLKGHFSKKRKISHKIFNVLWLQAAITAQWLQIAGNSLPK